MHAANINPAARRHRNKLNALGLVLGLSMLGGAAHAGSLELGNGIQGQYKLVANYSMGIRTGSADNTLINGPVDPFVAGYASSGICNPDQVVCFIHTGLPISINFDDADRNFDQWSLINNRLSLFGQLELSSDAYGIVMSGNAFYDQVYHSSNDNTSVPSTQPGATVNKTGTPNEFTENSSKYDGYRIRLLEAYAYGDWTLGEESSINMRFGKQVTAYGESLFLSGVSSAMGPFDATKAFVAGAEIKDIILPETRVSMQLAVNSKTTFLAEYQLDFNPTEIFSVGSYFSPADLVGPGSTFGYGSANPAFTSCPGLLPGGLTVLCDINQQGGIVANAVDGPNTINVVRLPDIIPSKYGHYSLGLKYQLTPILNVGAYRLRYANHNPTVNLNVGFAYIGTVKNPIVLPAQLGGGASGPAGTVLTTELINQPVPVSYNIKYFDGIDMTAISYSTVVGSFNIGGEFSIRQGTDVSVQTVISGVLSPISTRGDVIQALISTIYTNNPRFIADDVVFVGEAGIINVTNVDHLSSSRGINVVGDGGVLFYDRTSYGFQTLSYATVRNIIPGWDLQTPISFGMIVKGNPSMSGAFGPLYGEGDMRLGVGGKMQYLQNLEIGLSYNMFFGDADKFIGNSTLRANPYVDRDYATLNVKYSM